MSWNYLLRADCEHDVPLHAEHTCQLYRDTDSHAYQTTMKPVATKRDLIAAGWILLPDGRAYCPDCYPELPTTPENWLANVGRKGCGLCLRTDRDRWK